MTEKIKIVTATRDDLHAILALQKLAYRSEAEIYKDYTLPPLLQDESSIVKEFEAGTILKAVSEDRIIGSVRTLQSEEICHIGKLIVAPEASGRGLGKRLMAAIEKTYAHAESFKLSTGHKSLKNLNLYENLGYRVVGMEPVTANLTLVKMEKP